MAIIHVKKNMDTYDTIRMEIAMLNNYLGFRIRRIKMFYICVCVYTPGYIHGRDNIIKSLILLTFDNFPPS